jgi:hypothetical protein
MEGLALRVLASAHFSVNVPSTAEGTRQMSCLPDIFAESVASILRIEEYIKQVTSRIKSVPVAFRV